MGGKYHLKLNIGTRPIANKYREGKMKSTLKRELKACETVKKETIKVSSVRRAISRAASGLGSVSPVLGTRPVYLCVVRVSIAFCGGRGCGDARLSFGLVCVPWRAAAGSEEAV